MTRWQRQQWCDRETMMIWHSASGRITYNWCMYCILQENSRLRGHNDELQATLLSTSVREGRNILGSTLRQELDSLPKDEVRRSRKLFSSQWPYFQHLFTTTKLLVVLFVKQSDYIILFFLSSPKRAGRNITVFPIIIYFICSISVNLLYFFHFSLTAILLCFVSSWRESWSSLRRSVDVYSNISVNLQSKS